MEILVAILVIALIAAVAFAVMQRRPDVARRVGRPRRSPIGRRDPSSRRHDPMAAAVEEHSQAMDPQDVAVAERRLRAQAHHVAADLHTEAALDEHQRAPRQATHRGPYAGGPRIDGEPAAAHGYADTNRYADPAPDPAYGARSDDYDDSATGTRPDGYRDPANDPHDDDPRYDGRRAADYVDPRDDDRRR